MRAECHGPFVRVRARLLRSRVLPPPPPELLPDAKRAEYAIENVFHVDGPNQLLKYIDSSSQMDGRNWRRKLFLAPGLLKLPYFCHRCGKRLPMACPRKYWEIGRSFSVFRSNCIIDCVQQALETLASVRADPNYFV